MREKFQIGQCWVIYIDEDTLPRCDVLSVVYMARVEEEEADKVVKICASEHLRFLIKFLLFS
ncbi:hypothetical protein RDI58_017624 [Solanum bulbocastanum]|uniref:Uncharacterized protein n=1 Tax=Solanum bulbocastanum TaxID=147425 RepID=A0AAN8TBM9_SOLBU